ncbi:hypothetical protein BW722_03505 [Lawsonia intracellularis]|uniref:hypothetical protein n=1 Tax=Lawsonia intracellularis TaxID=29546 RepID=UPI0009764CB3|nr:hypothetical protein [Lawsonia intracellularis]OMQ04347.1 hypothetical protein BW722_03505 [Lawsonia intracellularis]
MDNELFQNTFKNIVLRLDNGTEMSFLGRQFAGGAWYDEETNILTRQHLYVTDTNEHIYSIVSIDGGKKSTRAYRVKLYGNQCILNNGRTEMILEFEMLMVAVRALTGIDKEDTPSLNIIEETLRAANA